MAHFYELSLPSVEPQLTRDYGVTPATTGWLIVCWRLPWGFGALAAGFLVDRFGGARMLALFLFACAGLSFLVGFTAPLPILFIIMFGMGMAASIYHPAGLALISHVTTPEDRGRVLGRHGVFGSVGIAAAPFVAWVVFSRGFSWQHYYWLLAIPGVLLGWRFLLHERRTLVSCHRQRFDSRSDVEARTDWASFAGLSAVGVFQGMVYAGALSFMVRYLSESPAPNHLSLGAIVDQGAFWSSAVLLVGCLGQYIAGRIANPAVLERQLMMVTGLNVPCLILMAMAEGYWRVMAAAVFALTHFMYQPIYNSLISKYSARQRRSFAYGLSFTMTFGLGGFGAALAGHLELDWQKYGALAGLATLATICGIYLLGRNTRRIR